MSRAATTPLRLRYQHIDSYEHGLLQFVFNLLEGQVVLPLEHPSRSLYRETFEQLGQLAVRGVLAYLVRLGGWRIRRFPNGDRIQEGRLWDTPEAQSLNPRLGEASLSLLVEVFDHACGAKKGVPLERRLDRVRASISDISEHGSAFDRLLLHVVGEPLARLERSDPVLDLMSECSGLSQLTFGAMPFRALPPSGDRVQEALTEWGWAMPWIREHVAAWWARSDGAKLASGLEDFDTVSDRLSRVISTVADAAIARGAAAWLLPLLDFYAAVCPRDIDAAAETESLEWMTSSVPVTERQQYRDAWAAYLRPCGVANGWVARLRRAHPVDRSPPERILLAAWEDEQGGETFLAVERLRTHLERVIG